jgi:hypothetical protein
VNSFFWKPTRLCAQHRPKGCELSFPLWVVGVVLITLLSIPQAQAGNHSTHTLLNSKAFSGGATAATGFNPALLHSSPQEFVPSDPIAAVTISGTVWWDANDSASIDYPELGIPGAVLELYLQSDPSTPVTSVLTNSLGQYTILADPGDYFLRNATPCNKGCNLLPGDVSSNSQQEGVMSEGGVDPNDPDQFALTLLGGSKAQNFNIGEAAFPSQLISKRLYLTSSDPLQPVVVPEPATWLGLLAAGMIGSAYLLRRRKRNAVS